MQHDPIDEYRLLTYPVVLGKGKRLFAEGAKPRALKVIDHKTTSTGVSIDAYTPPGSPPTGRSRSTSTNRPRAERLGDGETTANAWEEP
jgi:RibD C-terminal domain